MKRLATFAAIVCIAGPLAAQAIGRLGSVTIWFDVFNHFVPVYCAIIFLGIVVAGLVRAPRTVILGIAALVITLPRVFYLHLPAENDRSESRDPLRMMIANVNYENRQYEFTIDLIEAWDDPDVLVFPEFMERWDIALEAVEDRYPYRMRSGVTDKLYGIAVYSKAPIEEVSLEDWPVLAYRAMLGKLAWDGEIINLLAIHPRSIHTEQRLQHIVQLQAINEVVRTLDGPTIVAGDFNTTPWSPNLNAVVTDNNLKDIRQGFGLQPTWPVLIPLLPIDGGFISQELSVTNFDLGPNIKSDHYPLLVEIR